MAAACRSLFGAASSGRRLYTADDSGSGTGDDKPGGSQHTMDSCARSCTSCVTEDSSELMCDGRTRQSTVEHAGENNTGEEEDVITQSRDNVLQLLSSAIHGEKGQSFQRLEVLDSQAVTVGNVIYFLGDINVKEVVQENHLKHQAFVSHKKRGASPDRPLRVVSRAEWRALPPTQPPARVDGPLSLVIINHTGFESSTTPSVNMALIRQKQLMHTRGRGWRDIAYNFLVGMDGLVYEGRGWGAVGSHNKGYNWASVGVAFIGWFRRQPPSPQAVRSLWRLLDEGVRLGRLSPDFRVVASCQCRPFASPGHAFFSLIRTWPRWAPAPPPPSGPPTTSTTVGSQQIGAHSEQPLVSTISTPGDGTPAVDYSSAQNSPLNRQSPGTARGTEIVTYSPSEEAQVEGTVEHTEDVNTTNLATANYREVPFMDTQVCGDNSESQVSTEKWCQEKKAVHVSRSRNVRVGGVTYVVGPLNITQVVHTHSGEKRRYTSRGSQVVSERPHLKLVSREQWLAIPAVAPVPKLQSPVRTVVVCQTGTKVPTSMEGERRQMHILQDFEVQCRGRADLPFNFVVAPSGTVYEGRGWELAPDLSPGVGAITAEDGHCLAVALLGAFHRHLPMPAALLAFDTLLQVAKDRGVVARDYHMVGHCQLPATGEALLSLLKKCHHWANQPFANDSCNTNESGKAPSH